MGNCCNKKKLQQNQTSENKDNKNQDILNINKGGGKNFEEKEEENKNKVSLNDIDDNNIDSKTILKKKGKHEEKNSSNHYIFKKNSKEKKKYEKILLNYLLLHEQILNNTKDLKLYIINKKDNEDIIYLYNEVIKNEDYQPLNKNKTKEKIIENLVDNFISNGKEINNKIKVYSYEECKNEKIKDKNVDLIDKKFIDEMNIKDFKGKETKCINYDDEYGNLFMILEFIKNKKKVQIENRNKQYILRKFLDEKDNKSIKDSIEDYNNIEFDKEDKNKTKDPSSFINGSIIINNNINLNALKKDDNKFNNYIDNNKHKNNYIEENKTNSLNNIHIELKSNKNVSINKTENTEHEIHIVFKILLLIICQNKANFIVEGNNKIFDDNDYYYLINKNFILNLIAEINEKINDKIFLIINNYILKQKYQKYEHFFQNLNNIIIDFEKENINLFQKEYNFKEFKSRDILPNFNEIINSINNHTIFYPTNFILIKPEIYQFLIELILLEDQSNKNDIENINKYSLLYNEEQIFIKNIKKENLIYVCDILKNDNENDSQIQDIDISYILIYNLNDSFIKEYNVFIKDKNIYNYISKRELKANINQTKKIINGEKEEIGYFITLKKSNDLIVETFKNNSYKNENSNIKKGNINDNETINMIIQNGLIQEKDNNKNNEINDKKIENEKKLNNETINLIIKNDLIEENNNVEDIENNHNYDNDTFDLAIKKDLINENGNEKKKEEKKKNNYFKIENDIKMKNDTINLLINNDFENNNDENNKNNDNNELIRETNNNDFDNNNDENNKNNDNNELIRETNNNDFENNKFKNNNNKNQKDLLIESINNKDFENNYIDNNDNPKNLIKENLSLDDFEDINDKNNANKDLDIINDINNNDNCKNNYNNNDLINNNIESNNIENNNNGQKGLSIYNITFKDFENNNNPVENNFPKDLILNNNNELENNIPVKYNNSKNNNLISNIEEENIEQEKNSKQFFLGLFNIRNNCYANSLLQCFYNLSPITNYFISNKIFKIENENNNLHKDLISKDIFDGNEINKNSLSFKYYEVIYHMYYKKQDSKPINSYSPSNFLSYIENADPSTFKPNKINDPKNLLYFMIDNLKKELNKKENIKNIDVDIGLSVQSDSIVENAFSLYQKYLKDFKFKNNSIIDDYFLAIKSKIITCQNCSHIDYKFESIYYIKIELLKFENNIDENQNQKINLNNCFEKYYSKEKSSIKTFSQKCIFCNRISNFSFSRQLFLGPKILAIILYDVDKQKNNFELFLEFNINDYLIEKNNGYELIGIVTYFKEEGMNENYISYCKEKENNKWYCCADDCIYEVKKGLEKDFEDTNRRPYLLFYIEKSVNIHNRIMK